MKITRVICIENLRKYLGEDLYAHANHIGITVFKDGKQNKGWKGHTLEILGGLTVNNSRAPNGLDFELKTCAFYKVKGEWVPKETMAIAKIKEADLINTSFFESHCWEKLKSLIFCSVSWNGKFNVKSELLHVQSFDFLKSNSLIDEIESDYEFIRNKLKTQGFEALTGRDGKWIQARTKGKGHGSKDRAFYGRKSLITEILKGNSD